MKTNITVTDLTYSYYREHGEVPVIDHLSFSVKAGEFVAIVGPSGCGKTTLLSLLAGLLKPQQGGIAVGNTPIESSSASIGYMLQKDHLLEWRTTKKNVSLGLEIQDKLAQDTEQELMQMLTDYGLRSFAGSRPSELSGGMRQRAALIRTLMTRPEILLLDEPFSALDAQTRLSVSNDVFAVTRRYGITSILITHDISEAISMADRILVLSKLPTHLVAEHPIDPELAALSPIDARNSPLFQTYFRIIWKELTT